MLCKQKSSLAAFAVVLGLGMTFGPVKARAADAAPATADGRVYQQAVQKAMGYLRTKGQATDGSFSAAGGPAMTAIITLAVLRNGVGVADPLVAKSLKYVEGFVQPDGGIYAPDSRIRNYETCLAVICLAEANRNGKYDKILKNADKYLKGLQLTEEDGRKPSDVDYGGVGYGGKGRPDLSNTHFLMDALQAAGDGAEDEAVKRALVFISRCQNLETEHNTTEFASKNPDGGFYYTPSAKGVDPAGKTANGGLRSYGSMTYAGLKSMIFAGVKADDPRVKAAVDWAQKNYTLEENPGMGLAGLYYYYHLFAKALDAMGKEKLTDADGKTHDWRAEMIAELVKRQNPNGSWVNTDKHYMEEDPNLVTGYALLTLSYCRPPAKK